MTFRRSLFAAIGFALLGPNANAGPNTWTLTGPGGGPVSSVAIHPTDASIALASAGNGIYRSVDGGTNWARTGDAGNGTDILFDPANANRVFVVSEGIRMYRSEDAGLSFGPMAGPSNATPHRLGISGNGTMYLADRQGHIYCSVDHGAVWTPIAHPWAAGDEVVSAIAVDPSTAAVVYVAVKDVGTYKSVNAGTDWTGPIANSPGTNTPTLIFQLVIKPDDPNRILGATNNGYYVSSNAGATWSQPVGDVPLNFAFEPGTNNNVIGVTWFGQIVRSSDGGLTWPPASRGANLRVGQVPRLAYAPANKVIAATDDGPMVSTDDGTTFIPRVSGIHAESVRSLSTADDGVTYATFVPGPFGVFRRAGATWEPLGTDALRTILGPYPAIQSITVAPGNSSRLFATGFNNQWVWSFNTGANWSTPHPAFTTGNPVLVRTVVDPADAQIIYVLTQNTGLWKSANGGSSFAPSTTGLPDSVSALAVDRAHRQTLYAGGAVTGATGVFKSLDAGISWTPTGTLPDQPVVDIVVDPANSNVVYAVLAFSLYKSTNGGAAWTEMSWAASPPIAARGVYFDPLLPTTMFIGAVPAGAGFSRSVDSGETWQHVSWTDAVFPSIGGPDVMALDRVFSGNVFAGGYGTGLYQYQVANDLRVTFTSPLNLALNATGSLTIPIENIGPFHAAAPEVQVTIPANLTVPAPAGCTFAAPLLRCTLPAIMSGQIRNLVLPYTAGTTAAGAPLSIRVVGRELDLVDTNNTAGIDVFVATVSNLGVTATATASTVRDSGITFSSTVTNEGPNASTVTTLVLQVPMGITVQTTTPTVGACSISGTTVTCELGALASGATASVAMTGIAAQTGAQSWSSAVSTAVGHDPVAANNTATALTNVTAPPVPPGAIPPNSGGGGGRFDWLGALLLGALALSRGRLRVSAHR